MNLAKLQSPLSMVESTSVQDQSIALGMAPSDVADVIGRYGPEVLSVLNEALKNGLSLSFVLELLRLFGPIFIDFVISFFMQKKNLGMVETDAKSELEALLTGNTYEGLPDALVKTLFTKLLPYVVEKYGPEIVLAIINAISDLTKEKTKIQEWNMVSSLVVSCFLCMGQPDIGLPPTSKTDVGVFLSKELSEILKPYSD